MDRKSNLPTLGIVAGRGTLPVEIAKTYAKRAGKYIVASLVEDIDQQLSSSPYYESFNIGSVGAIISYFSKFKVQNVIFAGAVDRPNWSSMKVDLAGARLLARILANKFLGDDQVLRTIIEFLEKKGFNIISALDVLFTTKSEASSLVTNLPISKSDENDIEIGFKVARTLGALDTGQSVIIEDRYIIGVEAAEGTDGLITRCADLRKKVPSGILVKTMKPNQDPRIDIPIIGGETIRMLAKFKYKGVAIENRKVIILDFDNTVKLADELGIFIKLH